MLGEPDPTMEGLLSGIVRNARAFVATTHKSCFSDQRLSTRSAAPVVLWCPSSGAREWDVLEVSFGPTSLVWISTNAWQGTVAHGKTVIIGAVIQTACYSYWQMFVARIIAGIGVGLSTVRILPLRSHASNKPD